MTAIATYLSQLDGALRTRGRARRRVLDECREHLVDAARVHGEAEAVRRFGSAIELAGAFDAETAARRGIRSTVATALGVLAVAGSTLALLDDAVDGPAVLLWAVVFFAAAQTSGVSTFLALLQAIATRVAPAVTADLQLLGRRNLAALGCALLTEFAAGAAVPGRRSIVALLVGPVVAVVAMVPVLRAWLLARRLGPPASGPFQSPVGDLAAVVGRPVRDVGPVMLLALTAVMAAVLAFGWNDLDHGSVADSLTVAAVEMALVVVGFLVLGRAVGVRSAAGDPVTRHTRSDDG